MSTENSKLNRLKKTSKFHLLKYGKIGIPGEPTARVRDLT